MPCSRSLSAIFSVVRRHHLTPVTGSPAVSSAMICSIAVIRSGVLWGPAPARAAHPVGVDLAGEQLAAAAGHGVRVQAEQRGDLAVATMADLGGFQAGVEA